MNPSTSLPILVIEDDDAIRTSLQDVLEAEQYEVFTAADGEKALELLSLKEYGLIILDWVMPNMSGGEFLETIFINDVYKKYRKIPLVVISALNKSLIEGHRNLLDKNFEIIKKPFDVATLINLVKKYC